MYHTGLDYALLDVVTHAYISKHSRRDMQTTINCIEFNLLLTKLLVLKSKNRKEQLDLTRCQIDHSRAKHNLILNDEQCVK
jgi:hypothetical protein